MGQTSLVEPTKQSFWCCILEPRKALWVQVTET